MSVVPGLAEMANGQAELQPAGLEVIDSGVVVPAAPSVGLAVGYVAIGEMVEPVAVVVVVAAGLAEKV